MNKMTGEDKKKNTNSSSAHAWLVIYNVAMTSGWLAIGIGMCMHFWKHRTHKGLYVQLQRQMLFFQTAAVFEILHSAIGIVRSNPVFTTLQVFSRVGLLWMVVEPVYKVQDSAGVAMFMTAWTLTEIVRYFFYTFHLLGSSPYLVLWLRYTLFIFLYPLGVMGELLTVYSSLPHVAKDNIFSVSLPNDANFSFNYYYVLLCLFPVYATGFPQLYLHMLAQRKKSLSPAAQEPKKED